MTQGHAEILGRDIIAVAPFAFQVVALLQWIVLAYLLAITIVIVTAGWLGDIAGRRRVLLAGIAVYTVASLLCGITPSLGMLIAARGAACMMALTIAFAGEGGLAGGTGRAMGLLGSMSAVGTALGPSAGGVLIALLGWRAIFLATTPLGMLALFLAARHLPADGRSSSDQPTFDHAGKLLLALGLAAYALAMTKGRGHSMRSMPHCCWRPRSGPFCSWRVRNEHPHL